jgi:hypothetical protein
MTEPTSRDSNSSPPPAPAAEGVTVGRDDPAPPAPGDEEKQPIPTLRRDNQGEAITGAPVV